MVVGWASSRENDRKLILRALDKAVRRRSFWVPDLERPRILHFETGCYICPNCPEGSRWFRVRPAGIAPDRWTAGRPWQATADRPRPRPQRA